MIIGRRNLDQIHGHHIEAAQPADQLQRLRGSLEEGDPDALAQLQALSGGLLTLLDAAQVEQLKNYVEGFDFDEALALLPETIEG